MRIPDTAAGSGTKAIKPVPLVLAVTAALALWALYRLRHRTAERNRVAGELQDTFLQSVQASKMLADRARYGEAGDAAALRGTVETLSEWLGQAILEGQRALNALRSTYD